MIGDNLIPPLYHHLIITPSSVISHCCVLTKRIVHGQGLRTHTNLSPKTWEAAQLEKEHLQLLQNVSPKRMTNSDIDPV